jgi:hypothetical protein
MSQYVTQGTSPDPFHLEVRIALRKLIDQFLVVQDTRISQHIARFYNYSGPDYSYGRRLLGLRFKASPPRLLKEANLSP